MRTNIDIDDDLMREAMEASRPSADNMRTRTAQEAGGEILDVHEFELAYAHLHVPEMA